MDLLDAIKPFLRGVPLQSMCLVKYGSEYFLAKLQWDASGYEFHNAVKIRNNKEIYLEVAATKAVDIPIVEFFKENPEYLL